MEQGLTYDDVLIIPGKSIINSRKKVNVRTNVAGFNIVPVIASNMESVVNTDTIIKLDSYHATGVLHRFKGNQERLNDIITLGKAAVYPILTSVGMEDSIEFVTELCMAGAHGLVLDVAHAHSEPVMSFIEKVLEPVKQTTNVSVIVGNIATKDAAEDLSRYGIDAFKVGIGPGAACTTRIKTGCGYPQLSAIMEIFEVAKRHGISIIADGGINNPGDVAKAIVAGADAVMIGKQLAYTYDNTASDVETPKKFEGVFKEKRYFGSASSENKYKGSKYIEGQAGYFRMFPEDPKIGDRITEYIHALQSACSYIGAEKVSDMIGLKRFIQITDNGTRENNVRF